jgi:hypothetical protein
MYTTFEREARKARREFPERFFFAGFAGFVFDRLVPRLSRRAEITNV